jgi:hypothetical protein
VCLPSILQSSTANTSWSIGPSIVPVDRYRKQLPTKQKPLPNTNYAAAVAVLAERHYSLAKARFEQIVQLFN